MHIGISVFVMGLESEIKLIWKNSIFHIFSLIGFGGGADNGFLDTQRNITENLVHHKPELLDTFHRQNMISRTGLRQERTSYFLDEQKI